MMMSLLVTLMFFLAGYGLLAYRSQLAVPWHLTLSFPVGLAAYGLLAWPFFLFTLPISILDASLIILSLIGLWYGCRQLYQRQAPSNFSALLKVGLSVQWQSAQSWPWLSVIWVAVGFSVLLLVGWMLISLPVSWDSLALYDYRAHLLASGHSLAWFWQWMGVPELVHYDFLHPWFPSFIYALIYRGQGTQPWLLHAALLLSTLGTVWLSWRSNIVRWLSLLLLVGSRFFVETATLGYAVLIVWCYWVLLFSLFSLPKLHWKLAAWLTAIFVSVILQSRAIEPFWVVFVGWWLIGEGWRHRSEWQNWIKLMILPTTVIGWNWASWRWLMEQYSREYSHLTAVDMTSAITQMLNARGWLSAVPQSIGALIRYNPSLPLLVILVLVAAGTYSAGKHHLHHKLWWVAGWLVSYAALGGGVVWYALHVEPRYWSEFVTALPRSAVYQLIFTIWLIGTLLDDYFLAKANRLPPNSKYLVRTSRKPVRSKRVRNSSALK
jgi:hypothetical protein